ncbi:MAG: hypothetical protein LBV58_02965 [Acholeplasmatales bacterium]|jgi:superoxide reductase|nr:hypothetical protein [Acholeplasmatales bacterium]
MEFYICKNHCKKIIEIVDIKGPVVVCCGEEMTKLIPNTVDASTEKHVPVITKNGNVVTVKVGEIAHPMLNEHYIEWIYLVTNKSVRRVNLKPGDLPSADFSLLEDEYPVEAYEYCNLHSLWKKTL